MSFDVLDQYDLWFLFGFLLLFWVTPSYYYFPEWALIPIPWVIGLGTVCMLMGILHYPYKKHEDIK